MKSRQASPIEGMAGLNTPTGTLSAFELDDHPMVGVFFVYSARTFKTIFLTRTFPWRLQLGR